MPSLNLFSLVVLASSHSILASSSPAAGLIQKATRIDARAFDKEGSIHLVDCHPREPPEEGAMNSTQTWVSLVIVRFQGFFFLFLLSPLPSPQHPRIHTRIRTHTYPKQKTE